MQATQRAGSGEPMVLVHGLTAAWRAWDDVAPPLAEDFDVLTVALAGHLDAAELPPGVALSVEALADAVERDMEAAGLATAHLVGHSLGGWVTLELAKRGRARSVVAISPGGGWEPGSREERRAIALMRRAHRLHRWIAPHAHRLMRRTVVRVLLCGSVVARPRAVDPVAAADAIVASAASRAPELLDVEAGRGGLRGAETITCPVLIAWGDGDRLLPRERYARHFQALPHRRMVLLRNVGHVAMWDAPELVVDLIRGFAQAPTTSSAPVRPG